MLIKNFCAWLCALPVAKRIAVAVALLLVLWFVVLPLIGQLLVFLRDAFIVYALPLLCSVGFMLAVIGMVSPTASKAIVKLLSVGIGAAVKGLVEITLAACGHKEKKKDDKDKKDKKDDGDDDDS